jgi:hypothetical protein
MVSNNAAFGRRCCVCLRNVQMFLIVIPAKAGIQFEYDVRSTPYKFCVLRTA